ncbi:virulence-associated E family protein [Hyphomicrobium sp. 99]|uniref:virulence-associated E family protein n=1 Tax=Hyphomicrobium sp. 99 TaxID=1163419 RepID=UPI000697FB85|nr:virulence-associated E family protein [Hyphomicrobium sp. 99]
MEKYTFADWQSGKLPPKGWDCADAVADGWGKVELDTYMRETAMPVDEWRAWRAEQFPGDFEKPAARPSTVTPAAPPAPAGKSSQDIIQQLKQTQQEKPEEATVTNIHTGASYPASEFWADTFVKTDKGAIKPGATFNWALLLENQKEMKGVLGYDEFAGRVSIVRRPPWDKEPGDWSTRGVNDVDISRIVEWLEQRQMTPKFSNVVPVIERVARGQSFHPVKDYLAALPAWDGVPRLDGWLETYAGVEATPLNRAFARKVLCAAVRRVRLPGCKFDHVLVLNGPENLGKSRLIRALSPDARWFGDQLRIGSDAKTVIEQSSGKWLIEMAEMIGAGRREVETIKHFVTTQSDRARKAYARTETEVQRQFILFGTSNEKRFLTSLTGNRRFWVVEAGKADVDGLSAVRDQLWSETVAAEPDENLYLEGELYEANNAANTTKTDFGAWGDLLDGVIPDGQIKLPVREAWKLIGLDEGSLHKISDLQRRSLQKALAGLGFDPDVKNLRRRGAQVKAYVRGEPKFAKWWPHEAGDDPPPAETLTTDW